MYVENICNFYPNALIILVDNNSHNFDDIRNKFIDNENVVVLTNNTPCKFEIGAYKVGITYLLENHIQNINYVFFTQDNYIIRKKIDLDVVLNQQKIMAAAIFANVGFHPWEQQLFLTKICQDILQKIGLQKIGLQDSIHKLALCCCSSFVLHFSKIADFFEIIKDVVITIRYESECSERYLSGILYYLNDYKISQLDPDEDIISHLVSIDEFKKYNGKQFFTKFRQFKNEQTPDDV